MRLIDADKLKDDIYIAFGMLVRTLNKEDAEIVNNYCRQIITFVDKQPTADAVKVVRCKDCDYSMGITEKKCPMWENIGDPNGYCKWCGQQLSSINER